MGFPTMLYVTGWSDALLVAHTTLLESPCHGSYFLTGCFDFSVQPIYQILHQNAMQLVNVTQNYTSLYVIHQAISSISHHVTLAVI